MQADRQPALVPSIRPRYLRSVKGKTRMLAVENRCLNHDDGDCVSSGIIRRLCTLQFVNQPAVSHQGFLQTCSTSDSFKVHLHPNLSARLIVSEYHGTWRNRRFGSPLPTQRRERGLPSLLPEMSKWSTRTLWRASVAEGASSSRYARFSRSVILRQAGLVFTAVQRIYQYS